MKLFLSVTFSLLQMSQLSLGALAVSSDMKTMVDKSDEEDRGLYEEDDADITFVDVMGDGTYPEGILTLPDGSLLVGGFGDGSLQRIEFGKYGKKTITYLADPVANGDRIVGFQYDEDEDILIAANFNFAAVDVSEAQDGSTLVPGSQMKLFSLKKNKLIATLPAEGEYVPGVFFNEVAIDEKKGIAYISDTFNPTVWTFDYLDKSPEIVELVTDEALLRNPMMPFGQNGLAITPNRKYLIVSIMDRLDAGDGTLVRIALKKKTNKVTPVKLKAKSKEVLEAFAGSDGMFFSTSLGKKKRGTLFMVNVFAPAGAIFTAKFNKDFSTARLNIASSDVEYAYNRPTASDIGPSPYGKGDLLWTVNSQLDHIINDENGALGTDPELPFQIVGVPLKELTI